MTTPGTATAPALRLHVTSGGTEMLTRDRTGAEVRSSIGVPDALSLAEADALARQLAPLRPGVGGPADDPLAADTTLTSLLGIASPLMLDVPALWRPRPPRGRLRVPIGSDADGQPVELDIKESAQGGMGPHGLIIGATGSGKSELLRTLVLGLALTHPPDVLNFVLVDFKGGATFLGLDALPHVSAVITNLADELPLVDRMRDALYGELVRRQELLRAAGQLRVAARLHHGPRAGPTCPGAHAVPRARRVLRAAVGQAGVHRPVRHDRPGRPVARRAPAARLAAPRGRQAARPGHPPVLPDRPADVLRLGSAWCSAYRTPTSCPRSRATAT